MSENDVNDALAGLNRRILELVQPKYSVNFNEILGKAELANMTPLKSALDNFSAVETIGAISQQIRELEAAHHGRVLVVTMRTIDGRIMDVQRVTAYGFSAYIAEGNINGMPCYIAAHISSLNLFMSFEEKRDRARPGFVIEARQPVTEPQPAPKQKASRKKVKAK